MCGRWTQRHWQHTPPGMKESSKFAAPAEKEKNVLSKKRKLDCLALLFFPLKEETAAHPCWKAQFCSLRAPCEALYCT